MDNMEVALDRAKKYTILEYIDPDYILEMISDQVDEYSDGVDKINYLNVLKDRIKSCPQTDSEALEELKNIKNDIYKKTIDLISDKFDFEIDTSELDIKVVSKVLYSFFILHYVDNVSFYVETYIINNKDSLYNEIMRRVENVSERPIPGIPKKMSLILENMSMVIDIVASEDVDLFDLIRDVYNHEDSKASVSKMLDFEDYIESNYVDGRDSTVYKLLEPIINEDEGFSSIIINIQRNLCAKFDRNLEE